MGEDVKDEEVAGEAKEERDFRFPMNIDFMEGLYRDSEGFQWKDLADGFWSEFLIGRELEFFKVPATDLDHFCCDILRSLSLTNLLADALIYFKLHSTWEIFICPSPNCLCWFAQHESLIVHLMCKHFSVWPFLQHNPTDEQWCQKTIRGTVWKPIDVVSALGMLSALSLDAKGADGWLNADDLGYLEWPLSEDSDRSKLLTELQVGVEMLLGFQEDSIRMLSNHCLRALIAVASHSILRHLDPSNTKPLPFKSLFYCSPLSFRFMETESLSCFVELMKQICKLFQDEASRSKEPEVSKDGDVLWSRSGHLDAVSFQHDGDCFVLDPAKTNLCAEGKGGITSWLFEAPIAPSIPLVPSRASKILKLLESKATFFSERLATFGIQSDFGLAEPITWIKLCSRGHWLSDKTHTPLLATTSGELASNGKLYPADVDHVPSPSSHSATEPTKRQKIGSDSKMMQRHLEFIKLTCELQLLELQVHQHSAIDLRMFILPLLRSYLRMKLYIFMLSKRYREIDLLQLCDVHPVHRESSPEYHACSNFKEERDADSCEDATAFYKGTCDICKEFSLAPLGFGSSGSNANSISEVHPMMTDGTNEEAGIDRRASHVTSADTALISRSKTFMATSITGLEAKPEAIHEADSVPESKAERGSQWLDEDATDYFWSFETSSDSDSAYSDTISECSDEPEAECQNTAGSIFPDLDWYEREHRAWETKKNGLFLRLKITDVVQHCLDSSRFCAAQSMWEWKRNRNLQYWICFSCQKRFADQASHMVHMECMHQLGLSSNYYSLVPSQVWQEDLFGVNGDVKERSPTLDDCIEVDETYSTFLVNLAQVRTSFPHDQDELWVERRNLFFEKVEAIRHQLSLLGLQFDSKCNLRWASQVPELDAEIVHNFAQLRKLKQELSKLCINDYKYQILQSIGHFLQDKALTKDFGELTSWACKRLEGLLGSVRCRYFPESLSTVLESTGKVIVNFPNTEIGFAYTGLSWIFRGDLPFKRKTMFNASFLFAGVSWDENNFWVNNKFSLDKGIKRASRIMRFKSSVDWDFSTEVEGKLKQFQADFIRKLRG